MLLLSFVFVPLGCGNDSTGSEDENKIGTDADADSDTDADTDSDAECDETELLAFPCAEGYGKHTSGGRGGDACEVTNLNSSGGGSDLQLLSDSICIDAADGKNHIRVAVHLVNKPFETVQLSKCTFDTIFRNTSAERPKHRRYYAPPSDYIDVNTSAASRSRKCCTRYC